MKPTKKELEQVEALQEKISDAALAYNTLRSEFEELRESIVERLQESHDDKSERWQESERGVAHQEFIDAWTEEVVEECPETCTEYPEEPTQ